MPTPEKRLLIEGKTRETPVLESGSMNSLNG